MKTTHIQNKTEIHNGSGAPIPLLFVMGKFLKNLIPKYLYPILDSNQMISNHQFSFQITIQQWHQEVNVASSALERGLYYTGVFLDVRGFW